MPLPPSPFVHEPPPARGVAPHTPRTTQPPCCYALSASSTPESGIRFQGSGSECENDLRVVLRANHAAKTEVAGRCVDGLRHARGRSIATTVVGGAQERSALHHLARDAHRDLRV